MIGVSASGELNPLTPSPWEVLLAVAGFGAIAAIVILAVVLVVVRRTSQTEDRGPMTGSTSDS